MHAASRQSETGVIQLGEPVAPYTLQRFKVSNTGELVTYSVVIEGRKTPLIDIRNNMLQQEQYMHLLTDSEIASMTEDDMRALLKKPHDNGASPQQGYATKHC